jgi:hypothetical protein
MVALRSERRVFLWRVTPRPVPIDAKKDVTLEEILKFLEAAFAAKPESTARAYLSDTGRILDDDDAKPDEKNQIYIAAIKRDPAKKTITFLVNRGDPNAAYPAFIDSETHSVWVEAPKPKESPFDKMGFAKDILVISAPPNEHQWFRPNRLPPVINHGLAASNLDELSCLSGLRCDKERNIGKAVGVVTREWTARIVPANLDDQSLCRRVSAISPSRLDGKIGQSGNWRYPREVSNVASFNGFFTLPDMIQFVIKAINENKGALGRAKVSFFGSPQPSSRAVKCEREPCDNEGRESRKNSAMVVNRSDDAQRVAFGDDEALLIWIIICVIGGPLIYALIKRGGEFFFGPDKRT